MSKVWVLQEVENSYEAESTILAIFDCKPTIEAICNVGLRDTAATELQQRSHAEQGTYILDEYELTEVYLKNKPYEILRKLPE